MTDTLSPTAHMAAELFAPVVAEVTGTKATLRVFGRIDSDGAPWGVSSADFQAALDSLGDGVSEVEIQVQSRGGESDEGIAIMNMIGALPVPTEAVIVGLAASAASYIVQGADKVTMMPHAQMMIHRASPTVLAKVQAPDLRVIADQLDSIDRTMANIYAEKAGGTTDEWLAAMTPESWYTAEEAVTAGLADGVRAKAKTQGAKAVAELDLSVFAYAGREHAPEPFIPKAPKTPAEPPVIPPNPTEEADTMSDTIPKAGLLKALGLADDADEDTILDAIDAKTKAAQTAAPAPASLDAGAIKAALEADGKTVVSKNVLDELTAQAQAGAQARAKQLEEERDATITAAYTAGKISAERRDAWKASWDKDPEGTKADLESLPSRFPVGPTLGHQGDKDQASAEVMSDAQADALAATFGVPKEALLNG